MPEDVDEIAKRMREAAGKALTELKWPLGKALGDHLAASNPANVLALLSDHNALKARLAEVTRSRDYQKDRATKARASREATGKGLEIAQAEPAALTSLLEKAREALTPFAFVGEVCAMSEVGQLLKDTDRAGP